MSSDYFMRQMEGVADALSFMLLGKKASQREDKPYELVVSSDARLLISDLQILVLQGRVNEAENLLFEKMEASLEPEFLDVADQFYCWPEGMDAETLAASGYSPEEIEEGRRDAALLYGK